MTSSPSSGRVDATSASRSLRFQSGTGYLLAIAGAASRRRWTEMLAQSDVTPTQFKVVMSLGETGPLGQRQLAELIGVDPRNCVPIVDSLVERDLLSREIDGTDRRRRVLCLTAKGRRLAQHLETGNAQVEAKLLSPFTSKEQVVLRRMLATIVEASTSEA